MKKRLKAFSRTTIALLTAALVCSPFTKAYADDTVDSLEKQTNGLQNQLDSLNQDLTSLSAEITDLASKIEDTDASVQKAELDLAAAKLDDVANYIPSRLAALLWIMAAAFTRNDAKGAWRIWRRDRRNHASPNSAQTESACAGALGVQLAGPAYYFGEYYPKPTIGDSLRPIEPEDILRANRMMYVASAFALAFGCAIRGFLG